MRWGKVMIDWIIYIIEEFVRVEEIKTNETNIKKLHDYAIEQGYNDSIGVFCAALISDRKVIEILTDKL